MISQTKNLNLFDNISYKYIKNIINCDDYDIEVEIKELDCDRKCYCKTQFKFSIPQLHTKKGKQYYKDATFTLVKEYNSSSPYALMLCGVDEEEEDD